MTCSCVWGIGALVLLASLDTGDAPELVHLATVSPSVLGITVQAGRIEYGRQLPYIRQDGDQIKSDGKERPIYRNGKCIGWLVGHDEELLYTEDTLVGQPLETRWADAADSYLISSTDDPDFSRGVPGSHLSQE